MGEVRERVRQAGWDTCLVVNDVGIVLGRLRQQALQADPDAVVETVMQAGPSTFRPDVPVAELRQYMHEHRIGSAVITTSAGRLVGLVYRRDIERVGEATE